MAGTCGTHNGCGKIIQSVVAKPRISQFSATNEKRTHTQHGMSQIFGTSIKYTSHDDEKASF